MRRRTSGVRTRIGVHELAVGATEYDHVAVVALDVARLLIAEIGIDGAALVGPLFTLRAVDQLPPATSLCVRRRHDRLPADGAIVPTGAGALRLELVVGDRIRTGRLTSTVVGVIARNEVKSLPLRSRHQWSAPDVVTDRHAGGDEVAVGERGLDALVARENTVDVARRIVTRIDIECLTLIGPLARAIILAPDDGKIAECYGQIRGASRLPVARKPVRDRGCVDRHVRDCIHEAKSVGAW